VARAPEKLCGFFRDLRSFCAGRLKRFHLAADLAGVPPFQKRALEAVARIPYGRTASYGMIARRIGSPAAARAVGSAVARNPVPLLIPCHRVIRGNGQMGGFGAGVEAKRWLLALEAGSLPRNVS